MDLSDDISYIANHLFLPPYLPQEEDRAPDRQSALLSHIVESAAAFDEAIHHLEVDQNVRQCWHVLHRMLLSTQRVRRGPFIDFQVLLDVVQDMQLNGLSTSFCVKL